jgi:hypothetical protein
LQLLKQFALSAVLVFDRVLDVSKDIDGLVGGVDALEQLLVLLLALFLGVDGEGTALEEWG